MKDFKKVKIGGLYRCCIQNLADTTVASEPDLNAKIQCPHCGAAIEWDGKCWKWDKEWETDPCPDSISFTALRKLPWGIHRFTDPVPMQHQDEKLWVILVTYQDEDTGRTRSSFFDAFSGKYIKEN